MSIVSVSLHYASTFCLKPSNVTASSGKTLLLPTPYSIKMALLDVIISYEGLNFARDMFEEIRDAQIWWQGCSAISVVRAGVNKTNIPNQYKRRRVRQEFCVYSNSVSLYFLFRSNDFIQYLTNLSRLGRSGSLVYITEIIEITETPLNATNLHTQISTDDLSFGLVQRMDDMTATATFEQVSTMNDVNPKKARNQYDIVIPYRLISSKRDYMLYEIL